MLMATGTLFKSGAGGRALGPPGTLTTSVSLLAEHFVGG